MKFSSIFEKFDVKPRKNMLQACVIVLEIYVTSSSISLAGSA